MIYIIDEKLMQKNVKRNLWIVRSMTGKYQIRPLLFSILQINSQILMSRVHEKK
jgi:hypothetical protein